MSAIFEHAIATNVSRQRSGRAFHVVRIVLGLLLLTAAGLKLYGLNVTALPRAGWFSTPRVQVFAAIWEMVLGLWLLSGEWQFGAWIAALGTFATFAAASAYFGWIGVASCGCFGVIKTSPWVAFGVDVAALVVLAITKPRISNNSLRLDTWQCLLLLAIIVLITLSILLVPYFAAGSTRTALIWLRNEPVILMPDFAELGKRIPGELIIQVVEVRNDTKHPLRIVGGDSDCLCTTTADLPVAVPPGQSRSLRIYLTMPQTPIQGTITREVRLITDDATFPSLTMRWTARISD